MLEKILNYQMIYIAIGIVGAAGILSKLVSQITLKRLVRAASNMNKSDHNLMRLIRAKFEHACMVSDRVENVSAFVDKFIYEYRVLGMKLHTWRRLEIQVVWLCAILGVLGAGISYYLYGMEDAVLQYGAMGGIGAVMMFLIHTATDENYKLKAAQVYMVDYLENVCAHRYAKAYRPDERVGQAMAVQEEMEETADEKSDAVDKTWKRSLKERVAQMQEKEKPTPIGDPLPEKESVPISEPELPKGPKIEAAEEQLPREAMIREILEEFLA